MINLEHVIEIALLMLTAYLCGCVLGYGAHRAAQAYAARPRFEARLAAQVAANIRAEATSQAQPARPAKSAARRLAGAVEREDASAASASTPPASNIPLRPPELPAPRGGKPDDLKKIKGVGAKTESVLNDLGIYHFEQIAAWSDSHIDWLEGRIAVRGRIRREQWVQQATLLMSDTAPA